jgi:hypothetical protein
MQVRKGSKFTPAQLERVRAAAKRTSQDPKWRASIKAAGKKRSQDPKWHEVAKAAGKKRAQDPEWREAVKRLTQSPKWREANQEAALRPDVIEAKTVYGRRQPWNRATITTDRYLARYDQGLCRYCSQARQPHRKDCRDCMFEHREATRMSRERKRASKSASQGVTARPNVMERND